MKDQIAIGLAIVLVSVIVVWGFMKATDGICNKTFSAEFKHTQQYRDMHCER